MQCWHIRHLLEPFLEKLKESSYIYNFISITQFYSCHLVSGWEQFDGRGDKTLSDVHNRAWAPEGCNSEPSKTGADMKPNNLI